MTGLDVVDQKVFEYKIIVSIKTEIRVFLFPMSLLELKKGPLPNQTQVVWIVQNVQRNQRFDASLLHSLHQKDKILRRKNEKNVLTRRLLSQGLLGWSGPPLGRNEALLEHCSGPQWTMELVAPTGHQRKTASGQRIDSVSSGFDKFWYVLMLFHLDSYWVNSKAAVPHL